MKTILLHYSVSPVIGGVEAVIDAHAQQFVKAGLPLKIIAGRGEVNALPQGVTFSRIDEMDTLHPQVSFFTDQLNQGKIPPGFDDMRDLLINKLAPELQGYDCLIVHNVLTKHFNLPLTAALSHLIERKAIKHTVAWCHDLTWSSPHSSNKVFPAYPWELLKTVQKNTVYVAISNGRRKEISDTFGIPTGQVPVIHNGVNPELLLSLSGKGINLMERLDLFSADLILLMPVRITQAKNIEFALHLTAALKSRGCHPKLIITGPPDPHNNASIAYYQSLLSLRQNLDLSENAHFIYECGETPSEGFTITPPIVSELYRIADAMLMPSHREGFGMPILEAGLLGLPVIATHIPAVEDLALKNPLIFSVDIQPDNLARQILDFMGASAEHNLRVKVRQGFTWESIFNRQIMPLLENPTT